MKATSSAMALMCAVTVIGCSEGSAPEEGRARSVTADGEVGALAVEDEALAQRAIEVLAADLDIPRQRITVDTVRQIDWRDSSIGCPQPDRSYLQVITPGHRITLRVDDQFHFVHEASGRMFVCKQSKSVGGITEKRTLVWGPQAMQARKDLAERLGVEERLIRIAYVNGTTFTDASLGCPEEGQTYETRYVEGYVLGLRYGNRDFTYHTDLERVIPCPAITED